MPHPISRRITPPSFSSPPVPGARAEEDAGAVRGPPAVGVLAADAVPRAEGAGRPSATAPCTEPPTSCPGFRPVPAAGLFTSISQMRKRAWGSRSGVGAQRACPRACVRLCAMHHYCQEGGVGGLLSVGGSHGAGGAVLCTWFSTHFRGEKTATSLVPSFCSCCS